MTARSSVWRLVPVVRLVALATAWLMGAMWLMAAADSDPLSGLVDSYLRIQVALAQDKIDGVKTDAQKVVAEAAKLGPAGAKIHGAAKPLAAASSLADARTAFGPLSEAIVAYLDANKVSAGKDVKVAFCSMVRMPWLQREKEIHNPYYGSQMLNCGEFKK